MIKSPVEGMFGYPGLKPGYPLRTFLGKRITMQERFIAVVLGCICAASCGQSPQQNEADTGHMPPQAGRLTSPLVAAGHLTSIQAAALVGDQQAVRRHVEALQKNMMRDMRLPDSSRPIDHEGARAAVRPLKGVRSSAWIDRSNLLVMVGGGHYRSMDTIDRVCGALEPLGDTLAVVVNLQDVMATTSEGADTLSRNCQLGAGERALFQSNRQVDVLDPEVRRVFREQQGG